MDHNNYIPAHGYYYPTTPPETQLMMPYNNFTPQQIPHQQITPQQIRSQHVTPQVTPQYEYDNFSFTESVSGSSDERSLSEPFIFKANTPPQAPRMCIPSNAGPHKFPAVPISPINSTPRVKAKRTPTACEECRKKKQKCDGEAPCQSCKEQHTECLYREVPPTKKDNSLEKMIEMMEGFSAQLANLSGRIDAMGIALKHNERRLAMMPHSCWQCGSGLHQQSC